MKAVIPAAGLGTRFLPYTKAQPKEMLPVVDKPTIQYVVEEAVAAGITDILIVTGRGKRAIEDHFDNQRDLETQLLRKDLKAEYEKIRALSGLAKILYVRQGDPLGLGHAILAAERYVGEEPFAVLLGDDVCVSEEPCMRALCRVYERVKASVVAVSSVPIADVPKYGMVVGTEVAPGLLKVDEIVEKPPRSQVHSTLVTIGRYCLSPGIWPRLRSVAPDVNGEIQLTHALNDLAHDESLYAWIFPGRRFDIGDKVDWMRATITLALERPDLRDRVIDMLKDLPGSTGETGREPGAIR